VTIARQATACDVEATGRLDAWAANLASPAALATDHERPGR